MYSNLLEAYQKKCKENWGKTEDDSFKLWKFYLGVEILCMILEIISVFTAPIIFPLTFCGGVIIMAILAFKYLKSEEKKESVDYSKELVELLNKKGYQIGTYDILIAEIEHYEKKKKVSEEIYEVFEKSIMIFLLPIFIYIINTYIGKAISETDITMVFVELLPYMGQIFGIWLTLYIILMTVHVIIIINNTDKIYSSMLKTDVFNLKRQNIIENSSNDKPLDNSCQKKVKSNDGESLDAPA